ncbi:MAG: FAD-dependent oxidoreductase [Candidatus Sumerlaeaceae bacterium]|nr:FAD-dependent oxidoreductase [Candidatus Sumerlaeaceae bacterium]
MDRRLEQRISEEHSGRRCEGDLIVYWMRSALRAAENPALEAAAWRAHELGLPLLVYQSLAASDWFASDRTFAFVLEGIPELQASLALRGIRHVLHLLPKRSDDPLAALERLATRAHAVFTEDFPCGPAATLCAELAHRAQCTIYTVDTACVLPMRLVGRAYERAFEFRRATQRERANWIAWQTPLAPPAKAFDGPLGFEPAEVDSARIPDMLLAMEIDHGVGRLHDTRGGETEALSRWRNFLAHDLRRYHLRRNDAADYSGVSNMSPYLHHGMIAAWTLARDAQAEGGEGAEKFLDELLVWRELAWCFCKHRPDHHSVAALPAWAREGLARTEALRATRPSLDDLERGRTGDPLYNLCAQSLLRHGALHNNVRMTWGKVLAAWFADPADGLNQTLELNHRYALDGCDPNSFGGILWCFGQFDSPKPEANSALGPVRPRPSAEHLRRLGAERFASVVSRSRGGLESCLVIGAGMSGLMAARTLADHGLQVTVLDKGRGVGGRMATRRVEGAVFDHGAQYFTVRDPRFARHVRNWLDAGVARVWTNHLPVVGGPPPVGSGHPRHVGDRGMTTIPKHLARDLVVQTGIRVTRVYPEGQGWAAESEDGQRWQAQALVLTPPVPQSLELLSAGDVRLAADDAAALGQVDYAPCIALLAVLDGPSGLPQPGGLFVNEETISWIADNAQKGISPGVGALTVHATPSWSREHYEGDPALLAEVLLAALRPHVTAQVVSWQVRKWRYSLPITVHPSECIFARNLPPLIFAGDAFGGPRIEGAALSGLAAAGRLLSIPAQKGVQVGYV